MPGKYLGIKQRFMIGLRVLEMLQYWTPPPPPCTLWRVTNKIVLTTSFLLFPSLCECSRLGTRADSFQCDENGQCTCKRNVVGKNCDKCLSGYFALEKDNPYGCRQCFCYGHSSDCKSAGGFTGVNRTSVFRFGLEKWKALNSKGEVLTIKRVSIVWKVMSTLGKWNHSHSKYGLS